jgi:hypothetical protein
MEYELDCRGSVLRNVNTGMGPIILPNEDSGFFPWRLAGQGMKLTITPYSAQLKNNGIISPFVIRLHGAAFN